MIFKSNREISYKLAPQLKFYDSMNPSWKNFYMFSHLSNLRGKVCNTDEEGLRFNTCNSKFKSIFDDTNKKDTGIVVGNSTAFGEGVSADEKTISNLLTQSTGRKYYNLCVRGFNGYQEILLFLDNLKKIKKLQQIVVITGINDAILPEYINSASSKFSPIYGQDLFINCMNDASIGWKLKILKKILSPFLPNKDWNKMNKLNFVYEMQNNKSKIKKLSLDYNETIYNSLSNNLKIWKMISIGLKINVKIFLQPICKWTKKELSQEEELIFKDEIKNVKIKKIFEIANLKKYQLMDNIYRDLCGKNELYYFDLNKAIESNNNEKNWLFNGNFHLSDLGTETFAYEIEKRLSI